MNIDHSIIDLQVMMKAQVYQIIEKFLQEHFPGVNDTDHINNILKLALYQAMASSTKKEVDSAKEFLDEYFDGDIAPGNAQVIFNDNGLLYKKKRNNDTETVDPKQLINELHKAGIDKIIIDNAAKEATKTRRGNTYYQVSSHD